MKKELKLGQVVLFTNGHPWANHTGKYLGKKKTIIGEMYEFDIIGQPMKCLAKLDKFKIVE